MSHKRLTRPRSLSGPNFSTHRKSWTSASVDPLEEVKFDEKDYCRNFYEAARDGDCRKLDDVFRYFLKKRMWFFVHKYRFARQFPLSQKKHGVEILAGGKITTANQENVVNAKIGKEGETTKKFPGETPLFAACCRREPKMKIIRRMLDYEYESSFQKGLLLRSEFLYSTEDLRNPEFVTSDGYSIVFHCFSLLLVVDAEIQEISKEIKVQENGKRNKKKSIISFLDPNQLKKLLKTKRKLVDQEKGLICLLFFLMKKGMNFNEVLLDERLPYNVSIKGIRSFRGMNLLMYLICKKAHLKYLEEFFFTQEVEVKKSTSKSLYHFDCNGNSILHWAIFANNVEVVKAIVDHDVRFEGKRIESRANNDGETPLITSVRGNFHDDIFQKLVGMKAVPLDYQDKLGNTALHYGVHEMKFDIVGTLLDMNADPHIINRKREKPLDILKKNKMALETKLEIYENQRTKFFQRSMDTVPLEAQRKGISSIELLIEKAQHKIRVRAINIENNEDVEFFENIGKGSEAVVKRMLYKPVQEFYAVKVFSGDFNPTKSSFPELNLHFSLSTNECICKLHYYSLDPFAFVMELCESSVEKMIETLWKGCVSPERNIATLIKGCVKGMVELHHAGVTHCDLKWANVLIKDQKRFQAKITDFGISQKIARNSSNKNVEEIGGTAEYVANEIWNLANKVPLKKEYLYKRDVYSFGIMMFEILYGKMYDDVLKEKLDPKIANDTQLRIHYIKDKVLSDPSFRPQLTGFPKEQKWLKDLIESMFDADPNKRPRFIDIKKEFEKHNLAKDVKNILKEVCPQINISKCLNCRQQIQFNCDKCNFRFCEICKISVLKKEKKELEVLYEEVKCCLDCLQSNFGSLLHSSKRVQDVKRIQYVNPFS